MNVDEIEALQEESQHALLHPSIQTLILEIAGKSYEDIERIFGKVMYEGGKEAVDALVFIGDFSQV